MDWSKIGVDGLTSANLLDDRLRRAIKLIEGLPENQNGSDKTWVERLIANYDELVRTAVKVR